MFRVWGKIVKNNKMVQSYTAQYDKSDLSEREMLDLCMEEICREFDIQKPLWLSLHEKDLARYGKVTFNADAFMEEIDFDTFRIEVLVEKDLKR
ncbi:MAG: hypothetical protein MJB12_11115 [Firmicutes bacterium]|nr:hypothetical protein [Bacillota bacterium]